mmetsp:Transcript_10137/g.23710  ORF Transcript_10137/g.23710 Transcript_10137/m.23710 type:complete len:252 (+) Transcript_10137:263-1018(+)
MPKFGPGLKCSAIRTFGVHPAVQSACRRSSRGARWLACRDAPTRVHPGRYVDLELALIRLHLGPHGMGIAADGYPRAFETATICDGIPGCFRGGHAPCSAFIPKVCEISCCPNHLFTAGSAHRSNGRFRGELKTQRSTCALSCGDGGCGGSEIFCRGWLVLEHRCIHRKLEDGEAQGGGPGRHAARAPLMERPARACGHRQDDDFLGPEGRAARQHPVRLHRHRRRDAGGWGAADSVGAERGGGGARAQAQ